MFIIKNMEFDSVRKVITDPVNGKSVLLGRHDCLVLLKLIDSFGRAVTRNELFDSGWPNRIVTDNSLNASIKRIRDALGDSNKQIIKSISGVGYELVIKPQSTAVIKVNNNEGEVSVDNEVGLISHDSDEGMGNVKDIKSKSNVTPKNNFIFAASFFILLLIEISLLDKMFHIPYYSISDIDGKCIVLLNLFTEKQHSKVIVDYSFKHEMEGCSYYFTSYGHIMQVTSTGFKEL